MGTNFYIKKICAHCGRGDEDKIHVGKSSIGWKFVFNGTERKTFEEWKLFLEENKDCLFDEYGEKRDLEEFFLFIESKKDGLDDRAYFNKCPGAYSYGKLDRIEGVYRFHDEAFC